MKNVLCLASDIYFITKFYKCFVLVTDCLVLPLLYTHLNDFLRTVPPYMCLYGRCCDHDPALPSSRLISHIFLSFVDIQTTVSFPSRNDCGLSEETAIFQQMNLKREICTTATEIYMQIRWRDCHPSNSLRILSDIFSIIEFYKIFLYVLNYIL